MTFTGRGEKERQHFIWNWIHKKAAPMQMNELWFYYSKRYLVIIININIKCIHLYDSLLRCFRAIIFSVFCCLLPWQMHAQIKAVPAHNVYCMICGRWWLAVGRLHPEIIVSASLFSSHRPFCLIKKPGKSSKMKANTSLHTFNDKIVQQQHK